MCRCLLLLVPDILSATSLTNRPRCQLSNLAFLQFFRVAQANLALSPYFFGLTHFDRIIELSEQTGAMEKFSKSF